MAIVDIQLFVIALNYIKIVECVLFSCLLVVIESYMTNHKLDNIHTKRTLNISFIYFPDSRWIFRVNDVKIELRISISELLYATRERQVAWIFFSLRRNPKNLFMLTCHHLTNRLNVKRSAKYLPVETHVFCSKHLNARLNNSPQQHVDYGALEWTVD